MKTYSASFQHYPTGFWVSAVYEKKKLQLSMLDTFDGWIDMYEERPTNEEIEQMKVGYKEAEEWTKQHTNKRFETADEANQYLRDMHNDVDLDC